MKDEHPITWESLGRGIVRVGGWFLYGLLLCTLLGFGIALVQGMH